MKPKPFEYRRIESLESAFETLKTLGPEAKIVAGGQSLVPLMNLRLLAPSHLIDICHIGELRRITLNGDMLRIGALVCHREVATDPLIAQYAPLLVKAALYIGNSAIRNRGTFGGSCCHADPTAEIPAASLLLGGIMELGSCRGTREVAAADFFLGPFTTAIEADEILLAVHIPAALPDALFAFHEFSRRQGVLPKSGIAARARCVSDTWVTDWVAFGVAEKPVWLAKLKVLFDSKGIRLPGEADIAQAIAEDLAHSSSAAEEIKFRNILTTQLIRRCQREFVDCYDGKTV